MEYHRVLFWVIFYSQFTSMIYQVSVISLQNYSIFFNSCLLMMQSYKHVISEEDHQSLHVGLNVLQNWSAKWLLKLNASKCKSVLPMESHELSITWHLQNWKELTL